MLVGSNNGGVDHPVFVVAIFCQGLEDPREDAALAPSSQALVGVLPVAEPLRKVTPRDARSIAIEDSLHEKSIVPRGAADVALPAGKEILDPLPLVVPQSITMHRVSSTQADLL